MWARYCDDPKSGWASECPPHLTPRNIFCYFLVLFLLILVATFKLRFAAMLDFLAYVPRHPFQQLTLSLFILGLFLATVFIFARKPKSKTEPASSIEAYLKFIYGCFLKPHTGDGTGSQQDALVR